MNFTKSLLVAAITSALLSACSEEKITKTSETKPVSASQVTTLRTESASAQANQLFDTIFKEGVDRNPLMQTSLGIKKDYDKWHDLSPENAEKELAIDKKKPC
jgi:lipoprotein NlpI